MFRLVLSNINMKQKGDIHIKHGKLVGGGAANLSTNFLYLNTNMDNINQLGYPERCHNYWFFLEVVFHFQNIEVVSNFQIYYFLL
jgi:hypothetical protein